MLRREWLTTAASLAALGLVPIARAQDVPGYRRAAFEVRTLPELLKALDLPAAVASPAVTLQAPDLVEDGSVVPVSFGCTLPGVQRLLLGIDRNPNLLAALFDLGEGVDARLSLRVKMQESSNLVALAVLGDGRVLMANREVRVTLGGCAGPVDPAAERGVQPTILRVSPGASGTTVRALMKHEMESGQRKDDGGRAVPAWHIQQVQAQLNGRPLLSAQWGTSVSKNPFLQFSVQGAKAGDRLALGWVDNHGARRSDEVVVG